MITLSRREDTPAATATWHNNCPFYGRDASAFPTLIATHGNQCALLVDAIHDECELDAHKGESPDWSVCPVLQSHLYPENRPARGELLQWPAS